MLTYTLFNMHGMLLLATSREGQLDADLHPVQNPEHALVSYKQGRPAGCWLTRYSSPEHALVSCKQRRPAGCWLTPCSTPTACSCQQQAEKASWMPTYILFKMLLLNTSREGQLDADLHTVQNPVNAIISREHQLDADLLSVQNPGHALVSNKERPARSWLTTYSKPRTCSCQQRRSARWWLTCCSKPRECSCQLQAGNANWMVIYFLFKPRVCSCQQEGNTSQILTYNLVKTQSMLLSAEKTSQMVTYFLFKTQCIFLSAKGKASQMVTYFLSKTQCMLLSAKGKASQILTYNLFKTQTMFLSGEKASQMVTYFLFKTQSMLLSATRRHGQPDGDLLSVQIQSMLLSATKRKGHPYSDLQPVQNPEHNLVSYKQRSPAGWWLTYYSKPRACSCQLQVAKARQMLTYNLFQIQSVLLSARIRKGQPDANLHPVQNPEHALVINKQEGSAKCWLTLFSKPKVYSSAQAGKANQMTTHKLFNTQSMLLSATSRVRQPPADLHPVQNPDHPPVSNKQEWPATC